MSGIKINRYLREFITILKKSTSSWYHILYIIKNLVQRYRNTLVILILSIHSGILGSYRSLFYFLCAIQTAKIIEEKNIINMINIMELIWTMIKTVYNNSTTHCIFNHQHYHQQNQQQQHGPRWVSAVQGSGWGGTDNQNKDDNYICFAFTMCSAQV